MPQFMLSVHAPEGADCHAMPPEEMQAAFRRIDALESELKNGGAWVFSGRLTEPGAATVVRSQQGKVVMTDGPFVESKEHLGGFYVIEALDLDVALTWAKKVTEAIRQPIEVRAIWSPTDG